MQGPYDRDTFGDRVGFSSHDNDRGGQHSTAYDREGGSHISWDTDRNGDYVSGSGHGTDHSDHSHDSWN